MTTQTHSSRPVPPRETVPSAGPQTTLTVPRSGAGPRRRTGIGRVVAGSLLTGLVAAALLAAAPFVPVEEGSLTGAVLLGFALGWAMLAALSTRLTDQPQRWAAIPALVMGLGGMVLLALGDPARDALGWVWPPVMLALAVWMVVRVRRDLASRGGRRLLLPVIVGLAVASVGGGYETVSEARDTAAYPMPGRLVDVGGHRLHVHCTGTGSPTVVLEPGAGDMSSVMGWVAPAVAADTRVCVYDRAGRGWSDPAGSPQDGTQIATDLHTLLHRANVPGPYVLAGHSFGGLYVLAFAARYPDEVAGMVLVDSTAPKAATHPATPTGSASDDHAADRVSALVSATARFGLGRLYGTVSYGSLPAQSRDEVRASLATAVDLRSTIDEYLQANTSMEEAAALADFADKPLVVLTAGSGSNADHLADQDRLATLSTNSVHRVIEGAAHADFVLDEQDAATTSRAVLEVVASVRDARPLAR